MKKKEPEVKEVKEEVYKPMAVKEPEPLERLEAVELRVKVLEDQVNKHNRQHFGRDAL